MKLADFDCLDILITSLIIKNLADKVVQNVHINPIEILIIG
jgi:hypothetical protein